jgi:hypothetical protein
MVRHYRPRAKAALPAWLEEVFAMEVRDVLTIDIDDDKHLRSMQVQLYAANVDESRSHDPVHYQTFQHIDKNGRRLLWIVRCQ